MNHTADYLCEMSRSKGLVSGDDIKILLLKAGWKKCLFMACTTIGRRHLKTANWPRDKLHFENLGMQNASTCDLGIDFNCSFGNLAGYDNIAGFCNLWQNFFSRFISRGDLGAVRTSGASPANRADSTFFSSYGVLKTQGN